MERLETLTQKLKEVGSDSSKIIKNVFPLMKEINEDPEDFLRDIADEMDTTPDKLEKDEVIRLLQSISIELLGDSETISTELKFFADSVVEGDLSTSSNSDFLSKVWNGDIYNKEGIEGLQELCADVKRQLKNANRQSLIDRVVNKLKKNNTV